MLSIIRRLWGPEPAERAREEERQRNARRAYAAQLIREASMPRAVPAEAAPLRFAQAAERTER